MYCFYSMRNYFLVMLIFFSGILHSDFGPGESFPTSSNKGPIVFAVVLAGCYGLMKWHDYTQAKKQKQINDREEESFELLYPDQKNQQLKFEIAPNCGGEYRVSALAVNLKRSECFYGIFVKHVLTLLQCSSKLDRDYCKSFIVKVLHHPNNQQIIADIAEFLSQDASSLLARFSVEIQNA